MGTRALVSIENEEGQEFCTLYRQFDGYPAGLGFDLKELLAGMVVVNGIPGNMRDAKLANRMGCLAAQVIKGLKEGPGNVAVETAGTRDVGEEYRYRIYLPQGVDMAKLGAEPARVMLDIYEGPMTAFGASSPEGANRPIYSGLIDDFDPDAVESE